MSQPSAQAEKLRSTPAAMTKHCTPAMEHMRAELVYGEEKLLLIFACQKQSVTFYLTHPSANPPTLGVGVVPHLDDEPDGPSQATGDDQGSSDSHVLVAGVVPAAARHLLGVSPVDVGSPHLDEASSVEGHQHGTAHTQQGSHHLGLPAQCSDPYRLHPETDESNGNVFAKMK
ncbi:hypothetical protein GW17_00002686 [Ensete ventricosum]|uniref:Uncharacterized protein n=1 Tax=Ensete ventricosum TaxID=4639 RepID=A0A444GCN5_ENSVE|nr:hypothetical protein GW17_00002686 [Ensete ventricosum]RZR75575.1 hypothetical protein BHM03_00062650 [Ensete ventricosum]